MLDWTDIAGIFTDAFEQRRPLLALFLVLAAVAVVIALWYFL